MSAGLEHPRRPGCRTSPALFQLHQISSVLLLELLWGKSKMPMRKLTITLGLVGFALFGVSGEPCTQPEVLDGMVQSMRLPREKSLNLLMVSPVLEAYSWPPKKQGALVLRGTHSSRGTRCYFPSVGCKHSPNPAVVRWGSSHRLPSTDTQHPKGTASG